MVLHTVIFSSVGVCDNGSTSKFQKWVTSNLVPAPTGYCVRSFADSHIEDQNNHSHVWDNAIATLLSMAVGDIDNAGRVADFLASSTVYDSESHGYYQAVSIDKLPPAADDRADWWVKMGQGSGANIALIQYGIASGNEYYVNVAIKRIRQYITWIDAEAIPEFPGLKPQLVRENNYIPFADTPWRWGSRLYKSFEETMEFIMSLHWASIATGETGYDQLAERIFTALVDSYWDVDRAQFYSGAEYVPETRAYVKNSAVSFDVYETAYLGMAAWKELEHAFNKKTGMSKEEWLENKLTTGFDGLIVRGQILEGARFSTAGNKVIGTEPSGATLSILWDISPDTANVWAHEFARLQFDDGSWWAGYDPDTGRPTMLDSGFGFSYDGKLAIAGKLALALLKQNWYKIVTIEGEGRRLGYKTMISGEYRLSGGEFSGHKVEWRQADADRGEWNWRYVYGSDRYNTFDPEIYSRLKVGISRNLTSNLNLSLVSIIDPWAFIGITPDVTIRSNWGDTAKIRLRYWSNTGMTIPEVIRTELGDVLCLPEIDVVEGKTVGTYVRAGWKNQWGQWNTFHIDALPVETKFRPVRKLGIAYVSDNLEVCVLPLTDEYSALSSDDPLGLANHHTWWEQSPWLNRWQPGVVYSEKGVDAFGRGYWSSERSFYTRDSNYERLTFLRGLCLRGRLLSTSVALTIASPMELWDEYDKADNVSGAIRWKLDKVGRWMVGLVHTGRIGFNTHRTDAVNQVTAVDAKIGVCRNTQVRGEVALSDTRTDLTSDWSTGYRGSAFLGGVATDSLRILIGSMTLNLDFASMEKSFYAALASYRNTRSDPWWGRHINFAESELSQGLEGFRLGNGLDIDRDVVSVAAKMSLFGNRLDIPFNSRDVHRHSSGRHIESVFRAEPTYRSVSRKFTCKLFLLYRTLPATRAGIDPLIGELYDLVPLVKGKEYRNELISEGMNPSTFTLSGGFRYASDEKWTMETVYEWTNDYSGFPQAVLAYLATGIEQVATLDGIRLDDPLPTLSMSVLDKNVYPLPPYKYHKVVKGKIGYRPASSLEITLTHTYNEDKFAPGMDDNINHTGAEIGYGLTDRLFLDMRYTFSRVIDLYKQGDMINAHYGKHHNVYAGCGYRFGLWGSINIQYGAGWVHLLRTSRYSAIPWALPTLDTQHLIRIVYSGKW